MVDNPKTWSHEKFNCMDWCISPNGTLYFYRDSDEEECEHNRAFRTIDTESPEKVAVYEYPMRDSDLPIFLKVGLIT